ncbi:YpoC family protein [Sporolactobacillus vineae]|uniref:YpoC family protein n=1 Tax=Sporolactobacillus vineae TaxID=444463 RepID=UPI0002FFB59E|nr:hypothetical protein [Sporolactobacillus vineae]
MSEEYPFFYDILYVVQPDARTAWPWAEPDDTLKRRWDQRRRLIQDVFHRRQKSFLIRESMIGALAEFIERMFWEEGRPVDGLAKRHLSSELNRMAFAPLNLDERIDYIARQPDRYTSYIQLNLLEDELTKKIAVARSRRDH